MKNRFTIKEIVDIALLTAILFGQKALLSLIPNIQLTIFFLVLYTKKLGAIRTLIITLVYTIIDSLVFGTMNIIFTPVTFIAWSFTIAVISTFFNKTDNVLLLSIGGIISSLLYSWSYILPSCLVYKMDFITYFLADLLFEGILLATSFLSVLFLYKPLSKVFDKFEINYIK